MLCTHREVQDAGSLLIAHKYELLSHNEDDVRRLTVRRKHLLEDTLKSLKRTPWKPSLHLQVVFIGEPGVDDGGPRQEYFRLLLNKIAQSNTYFMGPENKRVPVHNVLRLQDQSFYYIGQIIALSLLHDGPCFNCLAPTVARYILGIEDVASTDDIPDTILQSKVKAVSSHDAYTILK